MFEMRRNEAPSARKGQKVGSALDFLAPYASGGVNGGRSRSSFNARVPSVHAYSGSHGAEQALRARKRHVLDKAGQLNRYQKLIQDGTLAHRLNRPLPANTNFPESKLKGNAGTSLLETSTQFSVAHTASALAGPANASASAGSQRALAARKGGRSFTQLAKPSTAAAGGGGVRRVIGHGGQRGGHGRNGQGLAPGDYGAGHHSYYEDIKAPLHMSQGWPGELLHSETQLAATPYRGELGSPDMFTQT